jgi:hypothetical protein
VSVSSQGSAARVMVCHASQTTASGGALAGVKSARSALARPLPNFSGSTLTSIAQRRTTR